MNRYFKYEYIHNEISFRSHIYRVSTYHYNWHRDIEVLVVLKGAIEVAHDGDYTVLKQDDVIVYSSQCGHATLALEEDTMALVLHIDPDFFKQFDGDFMKYAFCFYSDEGSRYASFYMKLRKWMASLMKYSEGEDNEVPLPHRISIEKEFLAVADLLYDHIVKVRYIPKGATSVDGKEAVFGCMIEYIDEHFMEKIELSHIAAIGGYTESYASQFFKRQLGITFMDYVTRMRLREAAILLVNTDDLVVAIAHLCGFSDVKAFNVAFKRHFHMTPTVYRERARKISRHTMLKDWKEFISWEDKDIIQLLTAYMESDEETGLQLYECKQKELLLSDVKYQLQAILERIKKG